MKSIYIGMDAHSSTSTLVTVDCEGRELERIELLTNEKELSIYFKHLREKWGKRRLCLTIEEMSLSRWLYSFLAPIVDEMMVCNPLYITRKTQKKNDYIDAAHLAQQLRTNNLVGVFHDEHNKFMDLRVLVSSYQDIVNSIVKAKSQFKAIYLREGKRQQGQTVFGQENPEEILGSEVHRFSAKAHFDHLQKLDEIKERYLERFEKNKKEFSVIKNLSTIPGIGIVRANFIAAIVCDGRRFKNKHHFWSYCGLVSHDQVSAGKSYGMKKSRGIRALKSLFINAAQNLISISQSQYGQQLYEQYEKKNPNNDKIIRRNIARKIAAIALVVMKKDEPFKQFHELKEKRKESAELNSKSSFPSPMTSKS